MPTLTYPSVIQRYYKKFFDKREDRPSEDVCVLVHSNKVCVVTLSPDHKALKDGPIQSLKYVVETGGKKVGDVHGKRKLQAIKMRSGMPLCEITSGNGTTYTIKCPVRGKLCELNEKLLNDLTLLQNMPETNGYLAIILHYACDEKDICSFLLTEEQFLNGEVIYPRKVVNDGEDKVQEDETIDVNKESSEVSNTEVSKPADEGNIESDIKNNEMVENMKVDDGDKQKPGNEIKKDDVANEIKEDVATEEKIEVDTKDGEITKDVEATVTNTKTEADEEEGSRGKRRGGARTKKTPTKKARR